MLTSTFAIAAALSAVQPQAVPKDRWSPAAREVVDDRLIFELAMEREQLGIDEASVVYGSQQPVLNRWGKIRDRAGIGWMRLDGQSVLNDADNAGDTRRMRCGAVEGHDPIPGVRKLVPLPGRPKPVELLNEATGGPDLLLATSGSATDGSLSELAFAVVHPGETVQITTVHNTRNGHREELIELQASDRQQAIVLYRNERVVTACFKGTPPDERIARDKRLKALGR